MDDPFVENQSDSRSHIIRPTCNSSRVMSVNVGKSVYEFYALPIERDLVA